MTSIKLLEERVADLEKQIYGVGKCPSIDDPLPENSVVDSLLHANTLIASALSGREKANALVKRMPELNDYLDPKFENIDLQTEAKVELILTVEPQIREIIQMLEKMQELAPVLETELPHGVPELTGKLNTLTLSYLKVNEDSEALSAQTYEVFSKYNEIITSISKSLITLDAAVTAAEIAATPVKQLD
ncbi:uncharacterized protein LOC107272353 [Cephus cinctus]|uniref:Uncharacterized protein LOC107272353 n=1 Tax=Cephus cinctus TaxID=211228 RepID=A0AAJ7C9B0_CEPCN|nr:uncharacterized protein LOC107272353 [Cephus cinctus]